MDLVFITGNADKMFIFLKQHRPDFLLLDVNLPPYNGIKLLHKLKQENNFNTKFLF